MFSPGEFCSEPSPWYTLGEVPDIAKEVVLNEVDLVRQQGMIRTYLTGRLEARQEFIAELEQIVGDAEVLLQDDDDVEDLPDEIGRAAERNDVETVLTWLGPPPVPAKRINAKWRQKMNRTLLHEAEFEGYVGLMTLLLQMGAKVDPKSAYGMTPFEQTCLNPELEEASRLLLAWGAVADKPGPLGKLPHENARTHARNKKLAVLLQTPLGGRRCEIVGLKNRLDLNGKTGIAKRYIPKHERYVVELEHTDQCVNVRPANLQRRDRTPLDCGVYMTYTGPRPNGEQTFSRGPVFDTREEADRHVLEMEQQKNAQV
jgi:hypothetical protein